MSTKVVNDFNKALKEIDYPGHIGQQLNRPAVIRWPIGRGCIDPNLPESEFLRRKSRLLSDPDWSDEDLANVSRETHSDSVA